MPCRVCNLFPWSSCYHLAHVANVWLVFEGCTACSYLTCCPRPAQSFLTELLSCIRFILPRYNTLHLSVTFCEVLVGLLLQPAEPFLTAALVSRVSAPPSPN